MFVKPHHRQIVFNESRHFFFGSNICSFLHCVLFCCRCGLWVEGGGGAGMEASTFFLLSNIKFGSICIVPFVKVRGD